MKKILVVTHCILNRASKVKNLDIQEMNQESALRKNLLKLAIEQDIELLQLPCPEFTMYGSKRWGHVKDQFDNPFFRQHCKSILNPTIEQIKEYYINKDEFEILGIIAIDGSPSCGYNFTCKGDFGGELGSGHELDKKINSVIMKKESGVFIEELIKILDENDINIQIKTLEDGVTYLKNL